MAAKKLMLVLFGICVISTWILGSVTQAGAETMKCINQSIIELTLFKQHISFLLFEKVLEFYRSDGPYAA